MNRVFPFFVSLAVLASVAVAANLHADAVKRKATVGQKLVWNLSGSFNVNGNPPADVKETYTDVVKSVAADGSVTSDFSELIVSVNGGHQTRPPAVATITKKPSGEITAFKSPAQSSIRWHDLIGVYYPSGLVSVGDSWTVEVKANPTLKSENLKAEMKLTGEEDVDGVATYKVEGAVAESDARGLPGSVKSTYWLSKADGSLVKQESELTNVSVSIATISGTLSLTRAK